MILGTEFGPWYQSFSKLMYIGAILGKNLNIEVYYILNVVQKHHD